ncbi:ComEC/Rec2 family competence protein [Cohnella sp. 56]|uniref:ComEC/Rec2 family competence protein n=1 Tax=Cohnella sp. 56 TaxID=3113722 RepID=UPI0030E88F9F
MRAIVNFLNVGWGDAHLIRRASREWTLIDGGDGRRGPERDHPLDWMERRGADRLDWMILTHIHEDHLNGLIDIARSREVKRAVLPYPLPKHLSAVMQTVAGVLTSLSGRVVGMLKNYERLIDLLRGQGTDIRWRSEFGADESKTLWVAEGVALDHLYPWQGDPLPGLDVLKKLADEASRDRTPRADEMNAACEAFFSASNDDSSVYRLSSETDPTAGVLFGGDLTESGWRRLAARTGLQSAVWKIPHHGMADAFGEASLRAVDPRICVVPIDSAGAIPLRERWERLCSLSGPILRLTGAIQPGTGLRLTEGPIESWIGDDDG